MSGSGLRQTTVNNRHPSSTIANAAPPHPDACAERAGRVAFAIVNLGGGEGCGIVPAVMTLVGPHGSRGAVFRGCITASGPGR